MTLREEPLWNEAEALANVGGEAVVLRETAEVFLGECPKLLSALQEALEQGAAERFSAGVHRLKGAVGCLTSGRVFASILGLEQMAESQNFAAAATALRQVEQELVGLCRELREFCQVHHEVVDR